MKKQTLLLDTLIITQNITDKEKLKMKEQIHSIIPLRFINADLSKTNKKIQNYYKHDIFKTKGLYLYGPSGAGKTYSIYALAIYLLISGIGVRIFNLSRLFDIIRSSFSKQYTGDTSIEVPASILTHNPYLANELVRAEILIIDDIGKEKATEWVAEKLYDLINTRYENMKTTIFTSNLTLDELADKTGYDSIVSRIAEMCDIYQINSKDKRANGK